MAVTQIADIIVPAVFQNYITENSLVPQPFFNPALQLKMARWPHSFGLVLSRSPYLAGMT